METEFRNFCDQVRVARRGSVVGARYPDEVREQAAWWALRFSVVRVSRESGISIGCFYRWQAEFPLPSAPGHVKVGVGNVPVVNVTRFSVEAPQVVPAPAPLSTAVVMPKAPCLARFTRGDIAIEFFDKDALGVALLEALS